jgi:hypothetical protein
MGYLQKAVSQGRFSMVNMSYDAKIPDILHVRIRQFSTPVFMEKPVFERASSGRAKVSL